MEYSVTDLNSQRFIEISAEQWQKNCNEKQILLRYLAIPLQETEEQLWLGIDDMQNLNACEIFAFIYHKQIEPVLISSDELKFLLNALSPEQSSRQSEIYEENTAYSLAHSEQVDRNDPIIQILENLFKFCLQHNASDIHFEPQKEKLLIRLRIDGVLHIYKTLPQGLSSRLISRIKLLAKLDISETRLPQDGQFHFKTILAETLDFRVSTLPTHFGEKVVLRLQKNKPTQVDFLELGFNPTQKANLLNALSQPQGLILVTGPTGSGKSITLYSALTEQQFLAQSVLQPKQPRSANLFFLLFPLIMLCSESPIIGTIFILLCFLSLLDMCYYLTDIRYLVLIFLLVLWESLADFQHQTFTFTLAFCLLIGLVSQLMFKKEAFGSGDMLLLVALSPLFRLEKMLLLILTASLLGIGYYLAYWLMKKQKLAKLAFIPFISTAMLLVLMLESRGINY